MARRSSSTPLQRAAKPAAIAALVWVAVVAVGSGRAADDSLLGVANLDIVWMIVFGLIVVASVIFIIIVRPRDIERGEQDKRKSAWWVPLVLAALVMFWQPNLFGNLAEQEEEVAVAPADDPAAVDEPEALAPETVAQATDLLLLALGVGALVLIWIVIARRLSGDDDDADQVSSSAEQLHEDVVRSLRPLMSELRDGDDPRTGVLNAYAVLESALSSHRSKRRSSETPTEHLRRALSGFTIDPAPFVRLSDLYEIARFSEQEISDDQRQEAIAALEQARSDLTSRP